MTSPFRLDADLERPGVAVLTVTAAADSPAEVRADSAAETLAKIAATRANGAHLLVRVSTSVIPSLSDLPSSLHTLLPLGGPWVRAVGRGSDVSDPSSRANGDARLPEALPFAASEPALLPAPINEWWRGLATSGGCCRACLAPPSGGGLVLVGVLQDHEFETWAQQLLLDRERSTGWEAFADQSARARALDLDRRDRLDGDLSDDGADAPPVAPNSATPTLRCLELVDQDSVFHSEWRAARGGEAMVLGALDEEGALRCDFGRRVRGEESWTLEWKPPEELGRGSDQHREQELVLVRRCHPVDRGKVVRVLLDDEDLGPWHLGDGAPDGHWWNDVLRVPSDLIAGRTRARIRLALESTREITSFRFHFSTEPVPDGIWITDLEPDATDTRLLCTGRAASGEALAVGARRSFRGLQVGGTAKLRYSVPPGYPWFESWVGVDPASADDVRLRFELHVGGERRFRSDPLAWFDPGMAARVRIRGEDELTLVCRVVGGAAESAFGNWIDPVLWRETNG